MASFSTAFSMRTGFRPRFTPFRRDFLNLFVKSILAQLRAEGKTVSDLISALREPVERKEIRFNITEEDFRPVGERVISELERFAASHDGWHIADDNREGIRDPVMPMNFESDSTGGVEKMINELRGFFESVSGIDKSAL